MWSKPSPHAVTKGTLVTFVNERVEADLLFYDEHVVLHRIVCCIGSLQFGLSSHGSVILILDIKEEHTSM